jgi:hypothetical protein
MTHVCDPDVATERDHPMRRTFTTAAIAVGLTHTACGNEGGTENGDEPPAEFVNALLPCFER